MYSAGIDMKFAVKGLYSANDESVGELLGDGMNWVLHDGKLDGKRIELWSAVWVAFRLALSKEWHLLMERSEVT